ncbi:MAG TPA: hypothetical protein VHY33_01300 [Thermoanaerobaculia bacterium]|jgi:hypothetical protein|nr:hypothetical protein [Thermoanaerobaculia bacterium]
MRTLVTAALTLALAASSAIADDRPAACPCVPITHLWIVKTCNDWNCASTELAVANGDPQVIALPAGMADGRWLVIRRLAAGAAIQDEKDPFQLIQYDKMTAAVDHYSAMSSDMRPQLMTAPDGQVLVIALKAPEQSIGRRRPVQH